MSIETNVRALKALGDIMRLRILGLLLERECCVCEVVQVLDISQTRASRNLARLYKAGLLKMRKNGRWSLYQANIKTSDPFIISILSSVEKTRQQDWQLALDKQNLNNTERLFFDGHCKAIGTDRDKNHTPGETSADATAKGMLKA